MSTTRSRIATTLATVLAVFAVAGSAFAASAPPVKEVPLRSLGRQVDRTKVEAKAGAAAEDVCTVASHDICQTALAGSKPGEFGFANGVAGDEAGDVYVAETENNRVQELGPEGEFILMFGRNVNATKVKENAPQGERDICTAASKDQCQSGEASTQAGSFSEASKIAVDRVSGSVYVGDDRRVEKFDAGGHFVLAIGQDVNKTRSVNICTEQEIELFAVECQGGSPATSATEHDAFTVVASLAVDSASHTLYVGDRNRLQEVGPEGEWIGEPVTPRLKELSSAPGAWVTGLAADDSGDVYLVYHDVSIAPASDSGTLRKFDAAGTETASMPIAARNPAAQVLATGIAEEAGGRLAVVGVEEAAAEVGFGHLYDAATLQETSSFPVAGFTGAVTFAGVEDLDTGSGYEVSTYVAEPVAELRTGSGSCEAAADVESDATFDCALSGEVNPEGVSETTAWFEWGPDFSLGEKTPAVPVPTGETPVSLSASIGGLRPEETLYYQLSGVDANLPADEPVSGGRATLTTPSSPPRILSQPRASFVTPSSAVVSGTLNPENAATEYEFQYGACEAQSLDACQSTLEAKTLESAAYGQVGVTQELRGLQPGTLYRFRLRAVNREGEAAVGEHGGPGNQEGTFQTPPIAAPQAVTGAPSAITGSSAVLSGTVAGNGQPGAYTFELGAFDGAATQYGVVASGTVGAGGEPLSESAALSNLQPGTEYAYKLLVHSGQLTVEGATVTFTTASPGAAVGLPVELPLLSVPPIAFPKGEDAPPLSNCKRGYQRGKLGRCTKARVRKKTARKRRGKRARA